MKANQRDSFSQTQTGHSNGNPDKIELVNCPLKDIMCKGHLSEVNKSYLESEQFLRERDFHRSIETLKNAFYKTTDLIENPCANCAQLFRSTIVESMINIHSELNSMTKGIFGNKRYKSSYINADNALKEFGNVIL